MTNFDFLLKDDKFSEFADVAVKSEYLLHIDVDACVLNCRRAMEFGIKWIYSVDEQLSGTASDDTLVSLMKNKEFREIVGDDLWRRMDFIRKLGNTAAHSISEITEAEGEVCLENLYEFLDFIAYCYADEYEEHAFDKDLLVLTPEEALSFVTGCQDNVKHLLTISPELKRTLTMRRNTHQITYIPRPLDLSHQGLRSMYQMIMLDGSEEDEEAWLDYLNEFDA